ncbi:hypothetical protein [Ideonella dechloratans]|jgi:hypothetical protein|uniref:hypothetical protein n=1 Tax=Ideonella dechloratans TaxID=36863 RepID=UPI0035B3090D
MSASIYRIARALAIALVAAVAAAAAGPGGVALFVVLGLATLILWPFLRAIGRAFFRPARLR